MKIAIFAYSLKGCKCARNIISALSDEYIKAYAPERFGQSDFAPIEKPGKDFYGRLFSWANIMIFVGSCGIAVRQIAPHVNNKCSDPAVICIDELGNFIIPILSGHIGGANEMSLKLARTLSATPVITTATDINNLFSVDTWARRQGLIIDNMDTAKAVSAAILENTVPITSDFPIIYNCPRGTVSTNTGDLGIYITYTNKSPYTKTLRLIPPILYLGIGCRRGVEEDNISSTVNLVLKENNIDFRAIKAVASIDLKKYEQGLLNFCKKNNLDISFYTSQELSSVPGNFTPSQFVKNITGVDNVCERAALINADKLIVRKIVMNNITVAIAAKKWEVNFE